MLKRKLGQKGADGRGDKMQTSLQAGRKAVIFSRWEKVGRRKTGKNPLTSTKYSGGKLGFSEGEVRPSEQTVYTGHTS